MVAKFNKKISKMKAKLALWMEKKIQNLLSQARNQCALWIPKHNNCATFVGWG
jgi:hypothetical protein